MEEEIVVSDRVKRVGNNLIGLYSQIRGEKI